MSQSTSTTPADTVLIPATAPSATGGLFYTVAELRAAMSPVGYMTPADQINAAAAAAAQATANAAIPTALLGQPLGPVQANAANQVPLANLPAAILGASHYLGTWNASTNSPLIQSGVAPSTPSPVGAYYIVSVAGTQNIDGNSTWHAGDWIIWNGTAWGDISGQVNPVSSVAGLQGAVSTAQLATALAGSVAINSAGGQLNVTLGTAANTAAAGNDSRIAGAAATTAVYTYLADVAAISGYTGNAPALRTAGYYTPADGGGAFYTQSNTGAPAIVDGANRNWYLADVNGEQVNILQFGAKADGQTDMHSAWAAADAFAAANGKAVFIPSGDWLLQTPMVAGAIWTHGEAADAIAGHGTVIGWYPATPTDGETALTSAASSGGYFLVSDLVINGGDNLPTAATIVSSGWLPALASGSCTFSGSVMTASSTTGAWAVGQNVAGPGMTNFCTIESFGTGSGGNGTYNLSAAQTVSGSITATATGYPNLSAFKAGTAAFRATNSGVYRNCRSSRTKYGLVLDTGYGHVFSYNCDWQRFFGVYCRQNGYDFLFDSCSLTGIWSAILAGTGGALNGSSGGITFRAIRSHFGFSPLGIDILNDGGSSTNAGVWEFYGCSFEAVSEAMLRILPGSGGLQILFDMYTSGSSGTQGVLNPSYQLPTSIVSSPGQYYFYLPGQLCSLKGVSAGAANFGPLPGGSFPAGSAGVAYIGSINPNTIGDLDLDVLGPNVVFGGRPFSRLDARNPDYDRDFLRRREQIIRADLLDKGNLLLNPETATNWTASISGTVISVVALSSLTGSGGGLGGITIPDQIYRESNNPNVIVITNSTNPPGANLNAIALSSWNLNRSICFHAWIFSSGTGTASNVNLQLVTNNLGYYSIGEAQRDGTGFQEVLYQGERLADFGATSLARCNVSGNSAGQAIYIIGLMASNDRPAAPNPLPSAYAPNGLFVGAENNGVAAVAAPQIVAFQTTPPSGSFPNGSIGINTAGTTPVLYHYVGGAWVQGT